MLDRDVILQKINSIQNCLNTIEEALILTVIPGYKILYLMEVSFKMLT
jgi:hypothetical protein